MKLKRLAGGRVEFWCPGCKDRHAFDTSWSITGPDDRPTVSPSVLVTRGHFCSRHRPGDDCWCTLHEKGDENDPPKFKCGRCHSFIRDGQVQFLSDCTHELAGKTVPMVDLPAEDA